MAFIFLCINYNKSNVPKIQNKIKILKKLNLKIDLRRGNSKGGCEKENDYYKYEEKDRYEYTKQESIVDRLGVLYCFIFT